MAKKKNPNSNHKSGGLAFLITAGIIASMTGFSFGGLLVGFIVGSGIAKIASIMGSGLDTTTHNREDAIGTLLMSLFYEGRFHTFHPKTFMSRSGITVIRPLIYLPEKHVLHMAKELALPVVKSPCPVDGSTKREDMKNLMKKLKKLYPDAPDRFLHALQQDHYDLWQKE